jgi:excinuclease ABC subunit C
MDGLFCQESFRDFGRDALSSAAVAPPVQTIHGPRAAALRSQIQTLCPNKPGVYGMLDGAGELIYLGKAKQLRARLLSYFRPRSRPPKAGRLLRHARSMVWEICAHEFTALLREQELIRRWRPRWNVQGQPLRRRLAFLCLGRAPAPHAYLTRRPPLDTLAVFGPLPWTERMVKAVQRVNDCFRLRDCPQPQEMIFPEQGGLFPLTRAPGCLRAELGTCLAPCTGSCPQTDYNSQVQAAWRFLSGAAPRTLADLERQMLAAAQQQQFERAASLRDQWNDLTWLVEHLARLRRAQEEMSFVYPLTSWDGAAQWCLIHGARALACVPTPTDPISAQQAGQALAAAYAGQGLEQLLAPYEHHDGRLIVMQWFRQRPRERKKTLTSGQARALCERFASARSA